MARPESSDLKDVLTDEDWNWTPPFKATPLRLGDIEKVLSQYCSAVDEHIEKQEKGSSQDVLSATRQSWDSWKQKATDALMTYTHAGMRQPFGVRHRALLEKWPLIWLFGRSSNMYYFALAWQFNEWCEHALEAYYTNKERHINDQTERASRLIQRSSLSGKSKDALKDAVDVHYLGKQVDLLKEQADSILWEDEDEFHHREELLEAWLSLHGLRLDPSGKSDVLGYTFNRYERNLA